LKFKLDENLDVRLAATMHEKGLDGDTVLSEALSGASDEVLFGVHWNVVSLLICSELQRIQSQMRIDAPGAKNHIISGEKNVR
jgi:hypothetical protein